MTTRKQEEGSEFRDETPVTGEFSTVQGQKTLTVLLDQIEQRTNVWETCPSEDVYASIANSARDVPALVKALREAVDSFEAIGEPENKEPWSRDVAIEALSDIAQLLREPAEEKK